MIFRWLRNRRRRRLTERPWPKEWVRVVERLPLWRRLPESDRMPLLAIAKVLLAEKNWEGCGGLELTDAMRVTVAAQAALLVLRIDHDYYRRTDSILVYPSTFLIPDRPGPDGVVREGGNAALGLAHLRGPVVLAWESVTGGGENFDDGRNVVLHEFAHKLDMLDGWGDGTPPLDKKEQYEAWTGVMTREYERLADRSRAGRRTVLDTYGATNPAEFFAVATEAFFEKALMLERERPELYDLLRSFYRQDPARWTHVAR